jgi:hypothetical protein
MSALRIELLVVTWLCVAGTACRFGGPTGDPSLPIEVVDSGARMGDAPPVDASNESDLADDADASDGATDAQGGCAPPFSSAVCDPVCNTGCAALSRCDVGDAPRTGTCIGIWISGEGAICVKTATTDPCAVGLSCVAGTCRRLCYLDGDCTTAGTCCNTSIDLSGAPSGFKACTACAP